MTDPARPIVTTGGGRVRGTLDRGVVRYRDIPYAAAPIADARFADPRPAATLDVSDSTAVAAPADRLGAVDVRTRPCRGVRSFESLMRTAVPAAWDTRRTDDHRTAILALHHEIAQTIADRDPASAAAPMDRHFDESIAEVFRP